MWSPGVSLSVPIALSTRVALGSAEFLQTGLGLVDNLPLLLVVVGIVLIGAEALAPGAHFIVLGIALLFAGIVGLLLTTLLGLAGALLAGVLALAVIAGGATALYGYRELDLYGGKGIGRTNDSDSLRGKSGRVTERVTPTEGEVKLDSGGFAPYYSARSMDGEIPEGEQVMVLDPGGGNVLTVGVLDGFDDEIDRQLAAGRERIENDSEYEDRERA